MAEKTTNFGLTKPLPEEFYDVGVQNGNMDIIDAKLKELESGDITPESIGALPIEHEHLVATDLQVWLDAQTKSKMVTVYQDCTNMPMNNRSFIGILQCAWGGDWKSIRLLCVNNGFSYEKVFLNGTWTNWKEIADASKFLPLTGGTPSGSKIYFNDGMADVGEDKTLVYMRAFDSEKDQNNWRSLMLYSKLNSIGADLKYAIRFNSMIDGVLKPYNIFGEHNPELLTPVIKNLISGGEISMVKSIQRGVVPNGSLNSSEVCEVTISPVNPDKCQVIIDNSLLSASSTIYGSYLVNLTANKLTLSKNSNANVSTSPIGWQIIEYY